MMSFWVDAPLIYVHYVASSLCPQKAAVCVLSYKIDNTFKPRKLVYYSYVAEVKSVLELQKLFQLCHHQIDRLKTEWHFFATGHGTWKEALWWNRLDHKMSSHQRKSASNSIKCSPGLIGI